MLRSKIVFVSLFLSALSVYAEPYIPANDTIVLSSLPSTNNALNQDLRQLSKRLKKTPENFEFAEELAKQYLTASQITGDPRYASYAGTTLENWLKLPSPPEGALVIRASLKQFRHDFQGALADLREVLNKNPRNVQARIMRSNIHRVQGNYNEAIKDCRTLALQTDPLVVAICQSSITAMTGKAQWSYDSLIKILNRRGDVASVRIKTWALITLAEIADKIGDVTKAEQHLIDAKAEAKTPDMYLRSAYIDLLLDQNRFEEAYNQISESNPSDAMLIRKAIAAKNTNRNEHEKLSKIIKSRFMDSAARGDNGHMREEARFELSLNGNAVRALQLAKEN